MTLIDLDICTRYWVTVTTISYCGSRSTTEPTIIGIKDAVQFKLAVTLDGTPCTDWIKVDTETKVMDMETALKLAGADCGQEIPCFTDSQWQCSEDDDKTIIFQ